MGNICRSPTAEGVFRKLVSEQGLDHRILIDSAGTHSYHVGSAPDNRAQSAAQKRDIDLSMLRGRQFSASDFDEYDYVMVMDRSNLRDVQSLNDNSGNARVSLFLDYAQNFNEAEVPDPYYGGANGFEFVLDLIEDAANGLLTHIRKTDL